MTSVYQVQSGDTLWAFVREELTKRNLSTSNSEILKYMTKVAEEHGDTIEGFAKKYFYAGKSFEYNESVFGEKTQTNVSMQNQPAHKDSLYVNYDSTVVCDAIQVDSTRHYSGRKAGSPTDSVHTDSAAAKSQKTLQTLKSAQTTWEDTKKRQARINSLKTDKQKVIAYNRELNQSRDNYVIVDKKNFSATVYTWDGKVVKTYEVGVAKNKTDSLLRRSYTDPSKDFAATSAGIYTANYKATGRDAYRQLYNDRVLTLSNDGLREKGIGNGETGVALHQIPNGNPDRENLLRRAGATEANNRFSSGCVNFLPEDFDDLMSNIQGVGTKVYILPEDSNNYMVVKNGRLHFAQHKYDGKVATTSTRQDRIKGLMIKPVSTANIRSEGKEMAETLSGKKSELMRTLGLDNDTYNELAHRVLGIAGQETHYGSPLAGMSIKNGNGGYWAKENMPWLVNAVKSLKGNTSYDSRGLTQLKLDSYTDEKTVSLLKKYNITPENLHQPEKSAIATMIVLTCIYKNELPAIKSQIKQCGLSDMDAVLYCFQGRKWKIKNGTARSSYEYIQNVNKYMKDFTLIEYDIAEQRRIMRSHFGMSA